MLTEGFLAVLVILACAAGLGLGSSIPAAIARTASVDSVDLEYAVVEGGEIRQRRAIVQTWTEGFGPTGEQEVGAFFENGSGFGQMLTHERVLAWLRDDGVIVDQTSGTATATGSAAFATRYRSWQSADGLGAKVGAFVDGAGNFVASTGLPRPWAIALMAVLVASFAGTTLDTAIRLQRYVVQELLGTLLPPRAAGAFVGETGLTPEASLAAHPSSGVAAGSAWQGLPARSGPSSQEKPDGLEARATQGEACDRPIVPGRPSLLSMATNAYFATFVAVATAAVLAAIPASGEWSFANAGTGGLILWPLFGASNQLLAGLAFAVILFYLRRRRIVTWFMIPPMLFMLIVPAWAMLAELPNWWSQQRYVISALAVICLALETWMVIEAALLYGKIKGVPEGTTLGRGFDVLTPAPPAA